LKKGNPADLFELTGAIGKLVPVTLASKSKARRGYDLIAKDDAGPVNGEPIALTTESLGRRHSALSRALACTRLPPMNASCGGATPKASIKCASASALRTAISIFKDMLAGGQTEAMKSELKWLTGALGPARELDVFVKRAVTKDSDASGPGLGAIVEDFRKRRGQALEAAAEVVASLRFRQLILDAAEWITIGEWTRNNDIVSLNP
jgi:triphosphatase